MCQHAIQNTGKGQAQAWQAGRSLGVDVSHLDHQHNKVPWGFANTAINIAFGNSGRALRLCNHPGRKTLFVNLYFFFLLGFLAPLPLPLPLPPCLAR